MLPQKFTPQQQCCLEKGDNFDEYSVVYFFTMHFCNNMAEQIYLKHRHVTCHYCDGQHEH